MPFYTYIIESVKSGNWYYGHTDDIKRRLKEHNSGQNKSTKNKGPWKFILLRYFGTKIEANRFELKLKRLKNKDISRKNILNFL